MLCMCGYSWNLKSVAIRRSATLRISGLAEAVKGEPVDYDPATQAKLKGFETAKGRRNFSNADVLRGEPYPAQIGSWRTNEWLGIETAICD